MQRTQLAKHEDFINTMYSAVNENHVNKETMYLASGVHSFVVTFLNTKI